MAGPVERLAMARPVVPTLSNPPNLPAAMTAAQGGAAPSGNGGPVDKLLGTAASAPVRPSQYNNKTNWRDTFAAVARSPNMIGDVKRASVVQQILFTRRDDGSPRDGASGYLAQRPLVVTVPVMNYMLAKLRELADGRDDVYNLDDPNIVLKHWTVRGVGVTEQGTDRHPGPQPDIRGVEAQLNTVVAGLTNVHNQFAGEPKSGAPVFAVVRLERVSGKVYHLGADAGVQHKHIAMGKNGKPLYAWQVSLCVGDPASNLSTYSDADGNICRSARACIGRLANVRGALVGGAYVEQPPSSEIEVFRAASIPFFVSDVSF